MLILLRLRAFANVRQTIEQEEEKLREEDFKFVKDGDIPAIETGERKYHYKKCLRNPMQSGVMVEVIIFGRKTLVSVPEEGDFTISAGMCALLINVWIKEVEEPPLDGS